MSLSTPAPVSSGFGFILRKLRSKRGAATARYKKRQREFGVFVYNSEDEQGRALLRESLKSAASGFERLAVCLCAHALAPRAHSLVPTGSVCQGGGDEDGQKYVQNKQACFSSSCFP